MGTSNWQNIPWCEQSIMQIEPERVHDIGVGFGRWRMILREFGDVWLQLVLHGLLDRITGRAPLREDRAQLIEQIAAHVAAQEERRRFESAWSG